MTTENTDSTETLVVAKIRKPRSPNKPKTLDKQGVMASNKVDRFNAQRDEALKEAAARVNERFNIRIAEFVASLPDDVRPLVTGVNKPVMGPEDEEDTEAEEVTVAAAE